MEYQFFEANIFHHVWYHFIGYIPNNTNKEKYFLKNTLMGFRIIIGFTTDNFHKVAPFCHQSHSVANLHVEPQQFQMRFI